MEDIMEILYHAPIGFNDRSFGPDSNFVKAARVKCDCMDKLKTLCTDEQMHLLNAYFDADSEIMENIAHLKFTYGFHLGAMLMQEILRGREEMLK